MQPTLQLAPERFDEFKAFLANRGFSFESRPHQVFLARKGSAIVNLYTNGKVVLGGSDTKSIEEVVSQLILLGAVALQKKEAELPPLELSFPHIGTDEVGKGDYSYPFSHGCQTTVAK